MNMNADSQLIERSLAGDTEAFGGLVGQYQNLVCALTFSMCGNAAHSEELAQETFVAAWKNFAKIEDRSKFKSWLCGIARNLSRSSGRRAARQPLEHSEAIDAEQAAVSEDPSPGDRAATRDECALVQRALEGLPENYRKAVVRAWFAMGGIRAASLEKRTLGYCRKCRKFRFLKIRELKNTAP
jgi:RNA polymerase sigma factor (sigma-70 family)